MSAFQVAPPAQEPKPEQVGFRESDMKRLAILLAAGAFVFLLIVGSICQEGFSFFHQMGAQMKAGQKYMDSLTEADIPAWITRTEEILAYSKARGIGSYGAWEKKKTLPAGLEQLKVLRVEVNEGNTVSYIWLASMDRTELEVKHEDDGSYQFTARYDDDHIRVIWPKR